MDIYPQLALLLLFFNKRKRGRIKSKREEDELKI